MQHSGLVLTLAENPETREAVVKAIRNVEALTLGELLGRRLVVALEASTPAVAEYWIGWLTRLDGVLKVDIAFVSVEEKERAHVS